MKRQLLVCIFLGTLSLHASHLLNSKIQTQIVDTTQNGDLIYKIKLSTSRDCKTGSIVLPDSMDIGIYNFNSGALKQEKKIPLISKTSQLDCYGICLEIGVYESTFIIPKNSGAYNIISMYCCRAQTSNLTNDANGQPNQGYTPYTFISGNGVNSEVFCTIPPILMVDPVSIHKIPFDVENIYADSIVIEKMTPVTGASLSQSFPSMPTVFPGLNNVTYAMGFNTNFPFGGSSIFSIDMQNKELTIKGTFIGNFAVAYIIKSFKKGQLINSMHHEILVIISNSIPKTKPLHVDGWVESNKTGVIVWNDCNSNAKRYIVEKSEINFGNFTPVDSSDFLQNSYYDKFITAGTEYFYRIKADRGNNNYSYSDTARLIFWSSGIRNLTIQNHDITMYPMPANDVLNIAINGLEISECRIVDINGKTALIQEFEGKNSVEILRIASLNSGIYQIFVLATSGEIKRMKLIIE